MVDIMTAIMKHLVTHHTAAGLLNCLFEQRAPREGFANFALAHKLDDL